jgi:hypothetical protein
MIGHQNYINVLGEGKSHVVNFHLPREIRQFDSTNQALEEGFIPLGSPRGWSIGGNRLKPIGFNRERNTVRGYEADLILDEVDIYEGVEGYVASVIAWSDESVNHHFNISAQYYKRRK